MAWGRMILGVMWVVLGVPLHAEPAQKLEPLPENLASTGMVREMMEAATGKRWEEAAEKYEALAKDHFQALVPLDGEGLISVEVMLRSVLSAEQTEGIGAAWRGKYETNAAASLAALRESENVRPERFYEFYQRYRLSSAGRAALVEGGDAAARRGDAGMAIDFYTTAQERGWTPDAAREAAIEACGAATKPTATETSSLPYRGVFPFDASWYERPEQVGLARFFPLSVDGLTFFAGPRHVFAVKPDQKLAWRWATPDAWTRMQSADREASRGRGPVHQVAAFSSPQGAQVLVVRQPRQASLEYAIRALRASDGRVLWRTDADGTFANLNFASAAAVVGGMVYALAFEDAGQSLTLTICALDLMNGRLLFRTPLGTLPGTRSEWENGKWWNDRWENSAPAVEGRALFVSPNVGMGYAVDRFTGAVIWTREYENLGVDGMPAEESRLKRYSNAPAVCGEVIVAAAQDMAGVIGLDRATGKKLWSIENAPATTLIGSHGKLALFAGENIAAINGATGIVKWRWSPAGGLKVTGPAAVSAGVIHVPTSDFKIVMLSAENGKVVKDGPRPPALRPFFASEQGKRVMEESGLGRAFTQPPR